ncbi:MAG: branched-chain amino acid ABC transporter permease [Chloroflexota bacterium]
MTAANPKPARQLWQGQSIRFAPYIVSGLVLIILPIFLSPYIQMVMTKILIFAIFAIGYDLVFGHAGLLSLGHAAFFGVGGYTTGILMVRYGINSFWLGAPLGILMAGLVAAVFGFIALRVSDIYFLLVTFALGELLVSVATKWPFLSTHHHITEGVMMISHPDLGIPGFAWSITNFYYFVFLIFALCFFIIYRIVNSPFGYALRGVREDEPRMQALGYNTWLYKYLAFVIAGMFGGLAGLLSAYNNGAMYPASFGILRSSLVMLIVILGSSGTLFGPVIGAAVIIVVEFLASMYAPVRWPLILGSVFILSVMLAREGIAVSIQKLWRKVSEHYGIVKR